MDWPFEPGSVLMRGAFIWVGIWTGIGADWGIETGAGTY
jgi:hypothetical protein